MNAGDRRGRSTRRAAPRGDRAQGDSSIWLDWSESAVTEGMRWFEVWLRGVQRFWGAGAGRVGQPVRVAVEGSRRASDLPWIPQVEAQVIPLRRKTDQPGAEATRYSMRVPIPWPVAGAKVISIETVVGRGKGNPASPSADSPTSPDADRESQT